MRWNLQWNIDFRSIHGLNTVIEPKKKNSLRRRLRTTPKPRRQASSSDGGIPTLSKKASEKERSPVNSRTKRMK
jgi:hypothetical protein